MTLLHKRKCKLETRKGSLCRATDVYTSIYIEKGVENATDMPEQLKDLLLSSFVSSHSLQGHVYRVHMSSLYMG